MAEVGDTVCLRFRYGTNDGPVQAVLPMRCVADDGETFVGWTPPESQLMYWAMRDGSDPRDTPLARRFTEPQTTAPRRWQGQGVLRVIPRSEPFQIVHFWSGDDFAGWYVNLEARKTDRDAYLDSVDWHLDLWVTPDCTPSWKDEDEAEAAEAAGQLTTAEHQLARDTGQRIIDQLETWPALIGDWRGFRPEPAWGPLQLPTDWNPLA